MQDELVPLVSLIRVREERAALAKETVWLVDEVMMLRQERDRARRWMWVWFLCFGGWVAGEVMRWVW